MDNLIPPKVYELIKEVVNDDIKKFSISVHDPNKKGEGYLGEMCFVSLKDKSSGKKYHFVVKQAFSNEYTRKINPIRDVFMNEIHFYSRVWPRFQQFQKRIPSTKGFDKIVKCFGTTTKDGMEQLVLENIKFQNFVTVDKKKTFDKEHMEFIFKQYGKYHAISFAYRALDPEGYSDLAQGFKDIYLDFTERKTFAQGIELIHELTLKSLQPGEDDEAIEKYKRYVENGIQIFYDSNNYLGKYSAILHGDCWSNNMMFKYDESGKLCDMKFLDFQLSKAGTPVSDLSYFFYSGGSKESFDQLDHYLGVYHNSLLENIREFGLNSEDIYPFKELKSDWKHHCQLGFSMALMLWKMKFTVESDIMDLTDFQEGVDDYRDEFYAAKYDEIKFKKITRALILHLHENDFL